MPRRLTEEEKARREEEKQKKKAETAKKRSETMKERHEDVKKLKTDLEKCHNRVEQLTHPKMLPIHTIEALRNIEEETRKRNLARMKKPELIVMKRIETPQTLAIREENARRRAMEQARRMIKKQS